MVNPYVFIVGCPRSGTTLLQRMADAHPLLAIMPEAQWIPRRFKKRNGLTPEGVVLPGLIPQLLEDPRFADLQLGAGELPKLLGTGQPIFYADFVVGIFDLYGLHREKSLVGNKTPGFVRRLDAFHSLWPEARFVHLMRDGRDVCLSMLDWPKAQLKHPGNFATWKNDPISTSALWWELNVRLGRKAGNALGLQLYYEMRYEALVSDPAKECAALCAFLDLPYDEAMLRFHEGRTKADPTLDAKRSWQPVTRGLRDWRTQMGAEEVERFEAAAGELLDELGYERAVPHPRPEAVEQASRIRGLLAQDSHWKQISARSRAERPEAALPPPDSRAMDRGVAVSPERRAQA